jgi:hypothetical protein
MSVALLSWSFLERLSPLGTAATTGLLYQPQMIDDGDGGAISGMRIGKGNRSTWRKPATTPLCPPQIPHDLTWARTGPPRWEASDWPPELWHDITFLKFPPAQFYRGDGLLKVVTLFKTARAVFEKTITLCFGAHLQGPCFFRSRMLIIIG